MNDSVNSLHPPAITTIKLLHPQQKKISKKKIKNNYKKIKILKKNFYFQKWKLTTKKKKILKK